MKPRWRTPPRRLGPIEAADAQALRARIHASCRLAAILLVLLATGTI